MKGKNIRAKNWFFVIYILAAFLLINIISTNWHARLDLTENKRYTLSSSTKEILKNLDDIVIVKVFFSENLPPYLLPIKEQLKDLLEEYKSYAHGKIQVEFFDPTKDKKLEQQAFRLGIPAIQVNVYEKDEIKAVRGYLGVAIFYEDKVEKIPVVKEASNLEYLLTSKILKLTAGKQRVVGIILGKGESKLEDFKVLKDTLSNEMTVRVIDSIIPPSTNCLMVIGLDSLRESQKKAIDDYIMRGGKAIFLIDGVSIGKSLWGTPLNQNILQWTKNYRFVVNNDLILDVSNVEAPFSSGYVSFILPYPYWIKILPKGLNKKNPITRDLESLVLPWSSSVNLIQDSITTDITHEILVASSPYSWQEKDFFALSPDFIKKPKSAITKPYPLAVLLRGKVRSAFDDKKLSSETMILVVGNSRFLENPFIRRYPVNLVFLMNAVDVLSFGDALVSIRSKGAISRPIKPLTPTQKALFKYINLFLMPILVVVLGIAIFFVRKNWLKKVEESL